VASVLFVLSLLLTSSGASVSAPSTVTPYLKIQAFRSHIQHIVFLLQENRAFDDLFGSYCPTVGPHCRTVVDGTPLGSCVPRHPLNPSLGCIAPFNFTPREFVTLDMSHNWTSSHQSWNNGSMDGFFMAEGGTKEPFGRYNGTTVPVYWDLAQEYGLSERFFSSAMSYTLPNHWYTVASSSPSVGMTSYLRQNNVSTNHLYLNESNATPTIEDNLVNSSVSWKYYDFALPNYTAATSMGTQFGLAYTYENPLAGRAQSYAAMTNSHFQPRSTFLSDARNGTLPQLSWLMPSASFSDHPGGNLSFGENWVATVVNLIESSPNWNSTVLFIAWDDFGGFYDHVAPPITDAYGDGFRVPLLAIGPWVKKGYVDNQTTDFGAILHLMEASTGLPCVGARDCHAPLLLKMFDFNRSAPRAPILFALYPWAKYPRIEFGSTPSMGLDLSTMGPPVGFTDSVPFTIENED
jgi:phospholipase C